MSGKQKVYSTGERVAAARRILAGESVSKLHRELDIKRSVLYRWRDAYRKDGEAGLSRTAGRPPGVPNPPRPPRGTEAEQLRAQVADLERKIGQQQVMLDFFKGAFKRVKEASQNKDGAGSKASTRRSRP
jgi:transposase-like protein